MTYTVHCRYGCDAVLLTTCNGDRADRAAIAHAVNTTHTTEVEENR